jgi:hypothetical protein
VGEETARKFYKLCLIFGIFPSIFNFDFLQKYKGGGRHLPPPPPPIDEGCLRIYCELNGRKHCQNLIISEHHHEGNFDISQSFTDI